MKYDRLYNFISPVTGKLPINRGYTLIGDKDGRSVASPVLIDVRQDIIDLKRQIGNFEELKKLDHNRIWIGDFENEAYPQLHIGIINLPPLAEAVFPNPASSITGDFRIPNPTFDYLSPFDWVMSGPFLPQIYATKYDIQGNPIGTDISSSLAMTQVRAAQIIKRFDNADFIVGSSTVTFGWENPKMYLIPETLKQLYGLGTTYTFTKAQSLGVLETGLLKNTVANGKGTLSQAISGEDYVNTADFQIGYPVIIDPLYPTPGSKLIAPMLSFIYRKNNKDEFKQPVANAIDVFEGLAAKFTQLAITDIVAGSLLRLNEKGEVIRAVPDIDYVQTITLQEYYNNIANYVNDINNLVSDFTNDIVNFFNENTNEILLTIAAATAAATITAQTSATTAEASAVTSTASAADAKVSAIEATSAASSAAASASVASSAASAAEAAVAAAVVASIFSGELGSAVSDARDAADDADDARDSAKDARDDARRALADLQDQPILVQGDVQGSGIIRTGILDANFSENPVFQGTHMIIPGVAQLRPLLKSPGMLRFNQNL